jgi:NitT/TauT family transport system substrate-binding protein
MASRPDAYFERFNLNTTTDVLNDPKRRAMLVRAVHAIAAMSHKLTANPQRYWPALAKAIDAPVGVIGKIWPQFTSPASLNTESLTAVLTAMEPWAAGVQKRQPRSRAPLAAIRDGSVARGAGV